ncbi:MAG: hypothetical protein ISS61_12045 [Desulfobacteraceae bacterium]|nr:hypothetical protein [Desulfobacteraceae bacterium]
MDQSHGFIEVDLFPEEVDSLDHPYVTSLKEMLEEVALQYHCRLLSLDIDAGTVIFSFDSQELMADILKILKNDE